MGLGIAQTRQMHSDSKTRCSFLTLLFSAGDLRHYRFVLLNGDYPKQKFSWPRKIKNTISIKIYIVSKNHRPSSNFQQPRHKKPHP
jgi:hypothetical protein